ncbi:peptidoglycan D,D-transpeptidase FtsI family protein [Bacillus benzoevorans]|uniref:serine-type D-Ala-D-Ala carboxypeptidase n=1 Tax=Bacillus benzoevorans TaxID=1456 RepID=A0A7X0HQC3_9BACI|nr:penicillin-binding protein 2 [Bacillus benzoevorans]MBB6444933.1 cell division protein FtsI/penicillin-binding protein 2 [Bacillus benzoevorans]
MKKRKKKKTHVPFRLNMLFFIVFVLFSVLVLRLGVVQIVYGDDYKREIERTEDVTVNNPVPRGKMIDSTGKIVVDNVPQNAITYTNNGVDQEEMLLVAERLSKLIEKDDKKVTERDKKDFWILKHQKKAEKKVSEKERKQLQEKYKDEEYDKKVYRLILDRITEKDLSELSKADMEVLAIYREFTSGYKFTPQIVKNKDVTPEEFAVVSENLSLLPGVDTTTDWERFYTYEDTLRSVLGGVTTSDKGLPAEEIDNYLSKGYSRNDRVGTSYLEKQYEDVLHGQKAKVKNVTDKAGNIVSTEMISEGQRGKDLILTVDMDLQRAVEQIIEEELWTARKYPGTGLLDRAYVVLMDPNTGEIKALAGKRIVRNQETGKTEMQDDALGTFTTTYNVGSAVKGATILTGYQTGAISPGTPFYDAPLIIAGTKPKKSWKNFGSINDVNALKVSSNVYMFHTAIKIGGGRYIPGGSLPLKKEGFDIIRQHFAQFGLGVRTGIDLPNEQIGAKGTDTTPGLMLDLAIGQYDTYSTLQMAQYVSTIANGGSRMEPHMVKEIREPQMDNELGPIVQEIQPKVLNRLDLESGWIERVQLGFRKVMGESGGTAYGFFGNAPYYPAGKTGTAQAFYDGPLTNYRMSPVMNLSLVGYAPTNNPEIAMAVIVPWAYTGGTDNRSNLKIGRRVMDTYFDIKAARAAGGTTADEAANGESETEKKNEE